MAIEETPEGVAEEQGSSNAPDLVQKQAVWVDLESQEIVFANQYLFQYFQDTFVLSVGQVFPPPVLGSTEERLKQLEAINFVPVTALGRFSFSRQNLDQLLAVLTEIRDRYDGDRERRSNAQD